MKAERIIAEVFKDGKKVTMVDLTDLNREDLEFFYKVQNAIGRVVVPKRREEE